MEDRHSLHVAQNPFAALFPSVEKAEEYRKHTTQTSAINVSVKGIIENDSKPKAETEVKITEGERAWIVNDMLQRVFLITVDNGNIFYKHKY